MYIEFLSDFDGSIQSYQFNEYSKGIYMLELDSDSGLVNKK